MNIYHGIEKFDKLRHAVVTSGTFDGVHIGHQKILSRLKELCSKQAGESVLLTFWPHPRMVLYPSENPFKLLNSIEEKAAILEKTGLDHLLIVPFTAEFANISSDDFVREILVEKIGTKKLIIGYNHRFGKNRAGSFEALQNNAPNFGFEVEEIPRQDIDNMGVSSTRIRLALAEGDIRTAYELLGRPYELNGTVVDGNKLGRTIGFPTANIQIDFAHKLIPADGTYAVSIEIEKAVFKGMMNIGYRPTVAGASRNIETHIFDFEHDIYHKKIKVKLHDKIREEQKFDSVELLKKQLIQDRIIAQEILRKLN